VSTNSGEDQEDRSYAKTFLSRSRNVPSQDLKVEKHADVRFDKVSYDMDIDAGLLKVFVPSAIKPQIHDNAFIDRWLEQMFVQYAGFVRYWMALYCYTNYQQLPVIVLTGPRGCGKSTFGEIVGEIFPDLTDSWTGERTNFTPVFTKKLLLIEENDSDKKEQYVQLKAVTGATYLTVNEKFQPQYRVRNNVKVIITTNEPRPLFLVKDERPDDRNRNNFFIYQVGQIPAVIPNFKQEILKRLGHYIQTELKDRYLQWEATRENSQARYGIPCPITQFEIDLFDSAQTGIEAEMDLLAEAVVCGVRIPDYGRFGLVGVISVGGSDYIKFGDIQKIIGHLELKASRCANDYLKRLMDKGVIDYRETRNANERKGYRILHKPSLYGQAIKDRMPI